MKKLFGSAADRKRQQGKDRERTRIVVAMERQAEAGVALANGVAIIARVLAEKEQRAVQMNAELLKLAKPILADIMRARKLMKRQTPGQRMKAAQRRS